MIVVVTPVFEDAVAAEQLMLELRSAIAEQLVIVAVDDGSVHEPVDVRLMQRCGVDGAVVTLKRNVGHQRAIAIGLSYAVEHYPESDCFVVMDSDGEDRPGSIRALQAALDGEVDVAVAKRRSRTESAAFKLFYSLYKWLFWLLTGRRISFGNFMAVNRRAAERLVTMQELWIHVASTVLTSKLRVTMCPLDRGRRYAGASKMNFVSLTLHGLKGVMVFAEDVLVRVGIACSLVAGASVMAGAAAVVLKLMNIATPGWFSIAIGILFLVFVQMGTVALITLLLTGLVRGGMVLPLRYRDFVRSVAST